MNTGKQKDWRLSTYWNITLEQRADGRTDIPLNLEIRAKRGMTNQIIVGGIDERDEELAKLIVQAPAMYEALKELVDQHRQIVHGERKFVTAEALRSAEAVLLSAIEEG